ncbi:LysM domain-containing protein [Apibacter mensalis]|uniref:LysM domain-containing protein n=1 Tax=Apibacter mensalis TaxID=1586267 RepID=A0A0X3ATI5_9FLAO|nr:LysM peptidoglycan-binding domain-containing protein [Apibacter mensalis]CVK17208.1 LysM domain-containing protein [Apibacter mensalis]
MKHKIYPVKKGDTLQNIAEKFQISVTVIREYHNLYCELTDLLVGTEKIPNHVKKILLPAEQLTEKEKLIITNHFSFAEESEYKVEIKNVLLVNDEPISENETENTWKISENNLCAHVDITNKKIRKSTAQIRALIEIINKINESTNHLELALNKDGTIQEVVNKQEIWKKWEEIKFQDIKLIELQDDFVKIIIEQYDQVFKNITKAINMNMLYQIVFCPRSDLRYPVLYPQILKKNVSVNSQIFPQINIQFDWSYTSKENNEYLEFSLFAAVPATELQHFNELYKKEYADRLQSKFMPAFKIESQYFFHKKTEKFVKAILYVKEQMSEKLKYVAQYKITGLFDEEPEENNPSTEENNDNAPNVTPKPFISKFLLD